MKRRRTTTRKPANTQHGSTTKPKRNNAPTAARQASSTLADLQQQVSALARELAEAREQQTATSEVLGVLLVQHEAGAIGARPRYAPLHSSTLRRFKAVGALELDAHHIPPVRWIGNPSLDTLCENRRRLGPARQGFPIRHPKPGASSWGERLAGPGHQIQPARPRCEKKREAQSDTTSQQRSTWDKSYDATGARAYNAEDVCNQFKSRHA